MTRAHNPPKLRVFKKLRKAPKTRHRCRHCGGTWSAVRVLRKCPRCYEPEWQDTDDDRSSDD